LYEFLHFFNFGKFVKTGEFFAEVTNYSRSMEEGDDDDDDETKSY